MKGILALNVIAVLVAAHLGFIRPLFTDLEVRARYVELDRAGVINASALATFHPSYGFDTDEMAHRETVPRFVARPALDRERFNAILLVVVGTVNSAVAVAAIRKGFRHPEA
jgi:hypothetical protein